MVVVPNAIPSGGAGGVVGGRPTAGATNVASRTREPVETAAPEQEATYESATLDYQDYVRAPEKKEAVPSDDRPLISASSQEFANSYAVATETATAADQPAAPPPAIERGLESQVTERYENSSRSAEEAVREDRGQALNLSL